MKAFAFVCATGAILSFSTGCHTSSSKAKAPAAPPPSQAARPSQPPAAATSAPRDVNPQQWRTEARRWLGAPYRFGGSSRQGIDCSGFAAALYKDVAGMDIPRTVAQQFSAGIAASDRELRPGDLVFFKTTAEPVAHVGVWLGNNQFAHASTTKGVIISSFAEPYYSKRFAGAKRLLR